MKKRRMALSLLLLALMVGMTGCQPPPKEKITLATQFGIAYAPLEIMKQDRLLEAALPGVQVEWVQMGGPTGIREGMLAGKIDVGFMGIGPMLIGVDTGMPWKCFAALSANEVAFVTNRADIRSLQDIQPSDRIAILSPGSTQHILLCMAAEKALGNADALDTQLVSMSHPDAMTAMLAGSEIALHIATPPYTELELENGMHKILTGQEVMGGPFTFICGVALTRLYEEQPALYTALTQSLQKATETLNADMPGAARRLAPLYGIPEAVLLQAMRYQGSIYGTSLHGVDRFAAAMARLGLLSQAPTADQYAFAGVEVLP